MEPKSKPRNPVLDLKMDKMTRCFHESMPDALYMTAYELQEEHEQEGFTALEWESFLDAPDTQMFIESKIAKLMEVNARKALNRLGSGQAFGSQEVTALKELIEKSKIIQSNQNRRPKVVLTYIPPRD